MEKAKKVLSFFIAAVLILAGLPLRAAAEQEVTEPGMEENAASSSASVEEGEGQVAKVAGDWLSGTSQEQPYVNGLTGGSQNFRIPALVTLNNGWILASADNEYNYTPDSPANIDNSVSLSKDGGKNWEWSLINHFVDYSDTSSYQAEAIKSPYPDIGNASYIDPALAVDSEGTVYHLIDAFPAYCGLAYLYHLPVEQRVSSGSTGFDARGNVLLTKQENTERATSQASAYTYHIDQAGRQDFESDEGRVSLRPVTDANGNIQEDTWVDGNYNLWTVEAGHARRLLCKQADTDKQVQNNVFYSQSKWKLYPTLYPCLRRGRVTEDGIEWGEMQLLNVKNPGEGFLGVCPGRGTVIPHGDGERILFQLYDNKGPNMPPSTIYSDDGGESWKRGARAVNHNGTAVTGESQTVLLPDGTVRMYSRNRSQQISYADSSDDGHSFGPYRLDPQLSYCMDCMVSFINVKGAVVDPQGHVHNHLLAASYPRGIDNPSPQNKPRTNGVVRLGSLDPVSKEVNWLNEARVRYSGGFYYSCLTQLSGGKLGLLYETDTQDARTGRPAGVYSGAVTYDSLDIEELLGEGWHYLEANPELEMKPREAALTVGHETRLSLTAAESFSGKVKWSLKRERRFFPCCRITLTWVRRSPSRLLPPAGQR